MSTLLVPVILSGGSGSRLWPLSRETRPKQFLPLLDHSTLLQATLRRVQGQPNIADPIVICNHEHRFMAAEQLLAASVTPEALILEPVGRNTAPAVAVAALHAQRHGQDPVLLVLPADHVIADTDGFRRAVRAALPLAAASRLITFGIQPHSPATGYGYIQRGDALEHGAFGVSRFIEKPDQAAAEAYLASGDYLWNSGMFMFRASTFLEELAQQAPAILDACRDALEKAQHDLDFLRLDVEAFQRCPGDSIDYAVMENTTAAAVLPLNIGWSDVGCWSALWQVGDRDDAGNTRHGDVLIRDTHNSYVYAQHRLVATVGVKDLVIIETPDAVLVSHRDHDQAVKSIVNQLRDEGRPEIEAHRKVDRPWGAYDSIDAADRFQVKHITVNPGARLSLQMHHHRAEHWIVVRGTARVTCDDREFLLRENESTFIPLGSRHRIENPGKIPLELIEVQSGSYLGEDDIVRYDDVYGRQDDD